MRGNMCICIYVSQQSPSSCFDYVRSLSPLPIQLRYRCTLSMKLHNCRQQLSSSERLIGGLRLTSYPSKTYSNNGYKHEFGYDQVFLGARSYNDCGQDSTYVVRAARRLVMNKAIVSYPLKRGNVSAMRPAAGEPD